MNQQAEESGAAYMDAEAKFKQIFTAHYKELKHYAYTVVKDEVVAEEIVQNVFCRLWERADSIQLQKATRPYLYKTVYNESLNHLRTVKQQDKYAVQMARHLSEASLDADNTDLKLLTKKAEDALAELPTQCRMIFQLSRMEGLKYKEIGERLGISVKTVETQMSKALRVLRSKLSDYLPVLLLGIITLKK